MEHPFFIIVVTLAILTFVGIVCLLIKPLISDKELTEHTVHAKVTDTEIR